MFHILLLQEELELVVPSCGLKVQRGGVRRCARPPRLRSRPPAIRQASGGHAADMRAAPQP